MSSGARKLNAEGVREFVAQVCRDFGIARPPDVMIARREEVEWLCGGGSGCFFYSKDGRTGLIIVSAEVLLSPKLGVRLVLHEVRHYIQLLREGLEQYESKTRRDMLKDHCEREHEIDAKVFSGIYSDFYVWKWERMAYTE